MWIIGGARTGSTWLLSLLGASERVVKVDEPTIGDHLAPFYPDATPGLPPYFDRAVRLLPVARAGSPDYFFSPACEWAWRPELRRLLLVRLWAQATSAGRAGNDTLIAIKEPVGSQAAEMLLSVLPRSRLLFLLRDGRDVLSSVLDGFDGGGWIARLAGVPSGRRMTPEERMRFLQAYAFRWLVRTEAVQRAYDAHPGELRMLVRYEDLRSDPETELRRIFGWLRLEAEDDRIRDSVERMSFEAVPESAKGNGEFIRSARPGAWRTDLTVEEQRAVEKLIGPKLLELGYPVDSASAATAPEPAAP